MASQESSEQQQQQPPTGSGSPRRRKPPLDIDQALYLQSQASYVQQPNIKQVQQLQAPAGAFARSIASSGSSSNISSNNNNNNTTSSNINKQVSFNYTSNSSHIAYDYNYSFNYQQQQQQQQQPQRFYSNNNNNNISVDYIDCLSNTDLVGADGTNFAGQPPGAPIASPAMRLNIPGCRKHLRFTSRNRVEPRLGQQQQQQHQQQSMETNSSSPSDEQPPGQANYEPSTTNNHNNNNNEEDNNQHISGNINHLRETGSVLYPISVSEVKKRSYFIGSMGQDDSLLGEEELHRYFPNGRVSIFVCTWNQNRKRAPINLNDLLLPEKLIYLPDIYAVGIQESFSSQQDYLRDWEVELQTTLGPNHVLLHSVSLGTLHLSIFVRRDLIWFCSTPEESVFNSRSMPTNMIKTKGSVSIAFRFFGTSFMFTNCHFPAHENKLKDRIEEYQRIINSIDLPKNLKLLKPRYLSQDPTARFDCCFLMGDLNFRLEQRTFDETITILEDIFQRQQQQQQQQQATQQLSFEVLTQCDELLKVMETDQAFHGFDESQIKFPPTYKFLAQTNKYDRQTKRVPSYTDRILFRSKRQRHIKCLMYDWLPQLLSSDHKPVYCLFDVLVRPGHEQQNLVSSLNAGLFQRPVYLEALKRRAEDPDGMRENGAGGSIICSIS